MITTDTTCAFIAGAVIMLIAIIGIFVVLVGKEDNYYDDDDFF